MNMGERFFSFVLGGGKGVGAYIDGAPYSLPYAGMLECIQSDFSLEGNEGMDASSIRLAAPIIPTKIVCLGWNYRAHNKELKSGSDKPIIFLKPSSAVIGPDEDIVVPSFSKQVEHEVELGVVIGKEGKMIKKEDALDHDAGYTIVLDMTARDLQWKAREKGDPWDICKGFDTSAPIGPWIVPKKSIADPDDLDLSLKVNGAVKQKSNTSDMINKVDDIIEYVSSFFTLKAGDVIATGTPEGVGPVKEGDVIEAEIEEIGVLRNKVASFH